jgi:hypothetical protein
VLHWPNIGELLLQMHILFVPERKRSVLPLNHDTEVCLCEGRIQVTNLTGTYFSLLVVRLD